MKNTRTKAAFLGSHATLLDPLSAIIHLGASVGNRFPFANCREFCKRNLNKSINTSGEQFSDSHLKRTSNFSHQIGKAEERVCFSVTRYVNVIVIHKQMINGSDDFVHALYITASENMRVILALSKKCINYLIPGFKTPYIYNILASAK
jgi:hypothetical protein